MNQEQRQALRKASPSVSPYLLRPLRTYAQAQADIAAARKSANVVTPFAPLAETTRTTEYKSTIAA